MSDERRLQYVYDLIGSQADPRAVLEYADSFDKAAGIYRVSLDAAIEAAAEADFKRRRGDGEVGRPDTWESETESKRDLIRAFVRPLVTAAVMGGAQ